MIVIRHLLFCPANKPEMYSKALNSIADLVIFDFEDAVAKSEREMALSTFISWFNENGSTHKERIGVRINEVFSKQGITELLAFSELISIPGVFMIPKVRYGSELVLCDNLLEGRAKYIVLVENAIAIMNLEQIIEKSEKIAFVMIGNADLSSDINSFNNRTTLNYAIGKVIMACASKKIEVIDSPFYNLMDETAFVADVKKGKEYGFVAKAAIHPKQLKVINEMYTHSQEEINQIMKIIEVGSNGVGTVNGIMVDNAMVIKATKELNRYLAFLKS